MAQSFPVAAPGRKRSAASNSRAWPRSSMDLGPERSGSRFWMASRSSTARPAALLNKSPSRNSEPNLRNGSAHNCPAIFVDRPSDAAAQGAEERSLIGLIGRQDEVRREYLVR